jgi:hypothetical protein
MEVSGEIHAPANFTPQGKSPRYPLDRRLGEEEEEKSCTAGTRTRAVHPVAPHYVYWAIPVSQLLLKCRINVAQDGDEWWGLVISGPVRGG